MADDIGPGESGPDIESLTQDALAGLDPDVRAYIEQALQAAKLTEAQIVTVTVNLRRDAYQAVADLAEARGVDFTTALHQVIATGTAALAPKRRTLDRLRGS